MNIFRISFTDLLQVTRVFAGRDRVVFLGNKNMFRWLKNAPCLYACVARYERDFQIIAKQTHEEYERLLRAMGCN